MLDIQQAFLRRLDEFEVVRPSRSVGGQRRYSRVEITRVQYVVALVGEGMTLPAIRRVLELERRVAELEAERGALRAALAERDSLLVPHIPYSNDLLGRVPLSSPLSGTSASALSGHPWWCIAS